MLIKLAVCFKKKKVEVYLKFYDILQKLTINSYLLCMCI